MKNGKIVQVMGPVIDVEFEDELPKLSTQVMQLKSLSVIKPLADFSM